MDSTTLGRSGPVVSRVGLGLMAMSGTYGPADDAESTATIHAALDAGITLLDTGDFYGMGHNEMLLGSGSAPTTSTSTSPPGSTRGCPSRTPSARSRRW